MNTTIHRRTGHRFLLLGLALLVAACSDDATAPGMGEPVTIHLNSADLRVESLGETVQFTGRVMDAAGRELVGSLLEWSSDRPDRLLSLGNGAFRTVANGPARVTVRSGGAVAFAEVLVEQRAAGLALSLAPDGSSGGSIEGTTLRLWALDDGASIRARWADAMGTGVGESGLYPALESLDPELVQIGGDGTIRALADGIARVRVTLAPFSTVLTVHVEATFAVESCVGFGGESMTGREQACSSVEITTRRL